MDRDVQNKKKR